MKKEYKKGSEGWNFFRDFYLFIQEFAVIDSETKERNDSWWDDFYKAASELDKYRHDSLFLSLIRAFVSTKEEEQREINKRLLAS